jgi:hypothetical protein
MTPARHGRFAALFACFLASCGPPETKSYSLIRDEAALRGLDFLSKVADNPAYFFDHGADLMWAFYTLSEASADPYFKQQARARGKELALRWRKANPVLRPNASADQIYNMASGSATADDLGVIDDRLRFDIADASRRFKPEDFLLFNPTREAPPNDIPAPCKRCKTRNARGVRVCRQCGEPLTMVSPYDILFDALIATYTGHHYGVWLGGEFADVVQWLPRMRPYPRPASGRLADDFGVTYAITHIIYTLNDYCLYRLRPEWLPDEYQFLKTQARKALDEKDPETLGEFMDSLQAFGMTEKDPLIRNGIDYLLSHQNRDGSWGHVNEPDIYTRYHTTWTGIGGVMRYGWRGERVTVPEALRRLNRH